MTELTISCPKLQNGNQAHRIAGGTAVTGATVGMYGDLQGIADKALQEIAPFKLVRDLVKNMYP